MLKSVSYRPKGNEGYVYTIYGSNKYLKYVLASLRTLRRYDKKRPVALVCEQNHIALLEKLGLKGLFEVLVSLQPSHRSIIGFKHNIDSYLVFEKNIFLDCDILWCKNPDGLWQSLAPYSFTITGTLRADCFFGARNSPLILIDILLNRRQRTLNKFGLTHLPRVQSGIIYAADRRLTEKVCTLAKYFFFQKHKTHFVRRRLPDGKTEESDEWAFAMALSKLKLPVIPWYNGCHSPQIDYIESHTTHDDSFREVQCLIYTHEFVNNLRGIPNYTLRKWLIRGCGIISKWRDYKRVKPYSIHFGWKHEKQPFLSFVEKNWTHILKEQKMKNKKSYIGFYKS